MLQGFAWCWALPFSSWFLCLSRSLRSWGFSFSLGCPSGGGGFVLGPADGILAQSWPRRVLQGHLEAWVGVKKLA